ncbi:WecB/TagA/CpsF family glycosyltransferase [Desulfofalx alkaliphila]|uniref:WecB/TagA/CpsF family glycosyltransferase n=1 Tax=Desulfofalx alkaliphila TaxID=105483 RepID=UPI0004E15199|nr:WecB/TagA/CpsF family glycosyltransferase [Desulfofalx alkaliphila]
MRIELLGAYIDALNMNETVDKLAGFVKSGRPHQVITLNPEYLYRAQGRQDLLDLVNRVDLVTADGTGIVWAAKMAGTPVPERVTGIDLMLRLCARGDYEGWRVFLLGASPGVAQEAGEKLKEQFPGLDIVGTHHGYFTDGESRRIVDLICEAKPHLLFVALGMPRQEEWIARHQPKMGVPVAMGVGGSFDVISGRKERAPLWAQRMKIEWLYRLVKEPSRFRRQLVLPKFAALVIKRYVWKA